MKKLECDLERKLIIRDKIRKQINLINYDVGSIGKAHSTWSRHHEDLI